MMDTLFPFGLPVPTTFYLVVYMATLMIHVAFMNYVLAGSAMIAFSRIVPRLRADEDSIALLREWMPLMLSGAITAGVAPLLFIQILYQKEFYTANLLLFNRWMAILPVLIIGFYSLYLIKSQWLKRRHKAIQAFVSAVPLACFAFTAYSWTENHLLSVRSLDFWSRYYSSRSQFYFEPQLLPRLLVWSFGSIPTMVTILSWQNWYRGTGRPAALAKLALTGILITAVVSFWFAQSLQNGAREAALSKFAAPYVAVAIVGIVIQTVSWRATFRIDRFEIRNLILASAGLFLTVAGMTAWREAARIMTLGQERFQAHFESHAEAFRKGGLVYFVLFLAMNGGLIALVFRIVRKCAIDQSSPVQEFRPKSEH
jgi:hypothetical protein